MGIEGGICGGMRWVCVYEGCWDCCVFFVFFTDDGGSGMKSPFENEGICLRFGDEPASGRIGF